MTQNTPTPVVTELLAALKKLAQPERAAFVAGYFKTGPGQYGEGDVFWGLTVPAQRQIAKRYWQGFTLEDLDYLIHHQVHEVRLTALMMLVLLFQKTRDEQVKDMIYEFYLDHTDRINNWDLVDSSAQYIVGEYAVTHPKEEATIKKLAVSETLWERRIAMVSMFAFVKRNQLHLPIKIVTMLINDQHDLIQKAVGWVLRTVGDQDRTVLLTLLDKYAGTMPRTALRYALEHFDSAVRQQYMQLKNKSVNK